MCLLFTNLSNICFRLSPHGLKKNCELWNWIIIIWHIPFISESQISVVGSSSLEAHTYRSFIMQSTLTPKLRNLWWSYLIWNASLLSQFHFYLPTYVPLLSTFLFYGDVLDYKLYNSSVCRQGRLQAPACTQCAEFYTGTSLCRTQHTVYNPGLLHSRQAFCPLQCQYFNKLI